MLSAARLRIILVSDADRPLPLPPGLNFSHQYRGLFGDNSLNSATSQLTKNVPLHYSWVPVPISQDPDLLRQEPLEAVLVLLTRSNWTERRILEGLSWNQVLVGRVRNHLPTPWAYLLKLPNIQCSNYAKHGKIQGDGRKFLDRFKSYFGSQISQSLNEV